MRFSTAVFAFAAAMAPVDAFSLSGARRDAVAARDDFKIPGESPLELCPKDHDDDIIKIERVDLIPNPPEPGKTLLISAVGTVKETIVEGAYILLQIKYGLIRLISTKVDLCEQIRNVDLTCPIEKGLVVITKAVEMPKEIPPGKYSVFADVYSRNDDPITCLTATVVFGNHRTESNDDETSSIEL